MKTILSILMALLMGAHFAFSDYILFIGIDPDAIVNDGFTTMTVAEWVNSLPDPDLDAGFAIRTENGTILPEAHYGTTDIISISSNVGGRWAPYLHQVNVSSVDPEAKVFYDLYQWDYITDDWFYLASASAVLSSLGDKTYTTGDINPLYAIEWKPNYYGAVIPEPSTSALALLGIALLFSKRKSK